MRTSAKLKSYINVLDIGTSKICCLAARLNAGEKPEVLGTGVVPAAGIKAGAIVDLDKATQCIGAALAQAEKQAEKSIKSVVVNISSGQLKSRHFFQEIDIADGRQITAADVKRLVDGVIVSVPPEEEVIHTFPLDYAVDGETGVYDPRGLYGNKLGARVHLVTLPETQSKNLLLVLDRCHVSVERKVATPYASALAVLSDEEKEIGATVIDLGAGTTAAALFMGGGLVHLGLFPIGGNAITRDIAQGLSAAPATAERLKTLNGAAFRSPKDELERLIVPIAGEEEEANIQIPRADLIAIIVPRLEEILERAGTLLEEDARFLAATRRIVLCGGGSELQGIKEKATALLGGNVRLGKPPLFKGLPNQFDPYTFLTCIGLVKYAMMSYQKGSLEKVDIRLKNGWPGKVMQWIAQNF